MFYFLLALKKTSLRNNGKQIVNIGHKANFSKKTNYNNNYMAFNTICLKINKILNIFEI
jgi:hypothetical protein